MFTFLFFPICCFQHVSQSGSVGFLECCSTYISKNYYLRPELPVHLTQGTLRTQTDVLDATSD